MPGSVFNYEEHLYAIGFGSYHFPLKALAALSEIPGDLVNVGLALNDNLILESFTIQHGAVVAGFKGTGYMLYAFTVKPRYKVKINLFPLIYNDCQL